MEFKELEFFVSTKKPPVNFKDLTGYETDTLRVIGRAPNQKKNTRWNCQCKICGKYCVKFSRNINRDYGCGCQHNKRISNKLKRDLTSQRFGSILVLEDDGKRDIDRSILWKCKCDCGKILYIRGYSLEHNRTKSCGCKKSQIIQEKLRVDYTGRKFGKLIVLSFVERGNCRISLTL